MSLYHDAYREGWNDAKRDSDEQLAPLLDEARREALLDAAKAFVIAPNYRDRGRVYDWLRDRAAQAGPADLPRDPAGFAAEQLRRLPRAAAGGTAPDDEVSRCVCGNSTHREYNAACPVHGTAPDDEGSAR